MLIMDAFNNVEHKYADVYAGNNHLEYFAEISEAFFSTKLFKNDMYPFTNSELKQYDL